MANILGIAGSLRLNSHSTRALKLVLEKAATKYASETNLIDLREWNFQSIIQISAQKTTRFFRTSQEQL